MAAPSYSGP